MDDTDKYSNPRNLASGSLNLDDIEEISFVTKGAGNIVLQKVLNLDTNLQVYRSKMRIRNIVEINPAIRENLFCEFLARFKIFRFLLGPMLSDLTAKKMKYLPSVPNEFNVLKIFSTSKVQQFVMKFFDLNNFMPLENRERKKNIFCLKSKTFRMFEDEQILNYTAKFINNGKI